VTAGSVVHQVASVAASAQAPECWTALIGESRHDGLLVPRGVVSVPSWSSTVATHAAAGGS
jgi:hypothetical protein